MESHTRPRRCQHTLAAQRESCSFMTILSRYLAVLFFLGTFTQTSATGVFPPVGRIAVNRPISANGTCQDQVFCSHANPGWLTSGTCASSVCNASCPHGDRLENSTDLGALSWTSSGVTQSLSSGVLVVNRGYIQFSADQAPDLDSERGFSLTVSYLPGGDT